MEPARPRRPRRAEHTAEEAAAVLRKAWCRLRLSARDPARVPPWDAVVLTAASPEQAALYDRQLARARRLARFPPSAAALAVPDPDAARIGSGAATLHAVASLVRHLISQATKEETAEFFPEADDDVPVASIVRFMATKHVLLLHAGGDSKRVPWANPMGKAFLPVPFLADDNPDGPVPLLFDHILAVSASARQAFKNQGGLFIMTGDVLPCFDASELLLPDDAACIVTVPTTLDVASNHGVVVASKDGGDEGENYSLSLVDNLLQKPTMSELVEAQAFLEDGRPLLDTGIIAVRGEAWQELVALAYSSSHTIIQQIIATGKELSLYEDLVAAWVPTKHKWLSNRPFGRELIAALGRHKMYSFCSYDFSFLHFGTSAEVLDHFAGSYSGLVGRRHMCSVPETTACDIAATAVILSSTISTGVSVGEDSLVYDSSLSGRVKIGSRSIVVGVNIHELVGESPQIISSTFTLPDRHCLWEVPLVNSMGRVMVYCGLHDNPKASRKRDGTFCGKPWRNILEDLKIQDTDMWDSSNNDKCLWNARIFPIMSLPEMLNIGMWLMGSGHDLDGKVVCMWRKSQRVSLEELHRLIDYHQLWMDTSKHQADIAATIAKSCMTDGLLGRNLFQLCEEMLENNDSSLQVCKELLTFFPSHEDQYSGVLPQSRGNQVKMDLLRASGDLSTACMVEEKVWASVASETSSAVKYGSKEPSGNAMTSCNGNLHPKKAIVELPVRVDFVGGWSDTPPWSLERPGCVLNMAISLEGCLPVGAIIEATEDHHGVFIEDDAERKVYIDNPSSISHPFKEDDIFRLVKSALVVTCILGHEILSKSGLKIRTWANVPRGSGLGTSSILAAAVVKGLFQLMEDDASDDNVARAVLVVEQIMGTGGGWQDQIGGLYPGIKCTQSFPEQPLRLQVVPLSASPRLIKELEQRLLIVFTGQVRLAHRVLEKVVTRYLRRDSLLISSIKRLAELAETGREALMNGEVDELGGIMLEAWRLHQELDPFCSNMFVDELFAFADPYCCGYKLVGAGGGGFALMLARNVDFADELRRALRESAAFDVKVYDWNIAMPR